MRDIEVSLGLTMSEARALRTILYRHISGDSRIRDDLTNISNVLHMYNVVEYHKDEYSLHCPRSGPARLQINSYTHKEK